MVNPALSTRDHNLCPSCCLWQLKSSDRYCGLCGAKLLRTLRIYLDPANVSDKPTHSFSFLNKSARPLDYSIKCPPWIDTKLSHFKVEPGQEIQIKFMVDLDKLELPPFGQGVITFIGSPGNVTEEIEIGSYPLPRIAFEDSEIILGKPPDTIDLRAEVELAPIRVTKLTFEPPLFVSLGPFPAELDLGAHSFPVRPGDLTGAGRGTIPVRWAMHIEGLEDALQGTFNISALYPATLEIKELENRNLHELEDVLPDSDESHSFTVLNRGDEVLQIDRADIAPTEAYENIEAAIESRDFPLQVAAGGEKKISFHVVVGRNAKNKRHYFKVSFQSNDPRPDKQFTILIHVREQTHYGFISLDFGTTDSAAAYLDGKEALNVQLETDSQEKKILSHIFFRRYEANKHPPFNWCIGQDAKKLGAGDRLRFVKAIKTKTGLAHKEELFGVPPVENRVFTLEAEQIVKFILMDLLKRTRQGLRARPIQAILSVPTRFTLRQKAILKESFKKASEELGMKLERIETIDESLAAGFFFLVGPAFWHDALKRKRQYTLMVVDFGGGTTDVTLFRVHQRIPTTEPAEGIEKIEIIGAWGDENLGGEDITWKIARILGERFLNRPIDEKRDWRDIRDLEDEAEAVKLVVSEIRKLPRSVRREEVEKALRQMVELETLRNNLAYMLQEPLAEKDVLPKVMELLKATPVRLTVYSNNKKFKSVTIQDSEIAGIYEDKLKSLVDELQIMLRMAGVSGKADVVLLAGQSSQFPTVLHLLKDVGHTVDYVKDLKGQLILKECVSLGAILYSLKFQGGGLDFPVEGLNRIWTRLGRPKLQSGSGLEFEDLIPWGAEYGYEKEFVLESRYGDKIVLDLYENHTLGRGLDRKSFGIFSWQIAGQVDQLARCKLRVTGEGDLAAECFINGQWVVGSFQTSEDQ